MQTLPGRQPSDDVYQLIKSLTRSEKRAFRVRLNLNSPSGLSNTARLYEAINRQVTNGEPYDEDRIRQRLARHKKLVNNFTSEKTILYKQLLKCLRLFHADNQSAEREVEELLENANLLKQKGLYPQSERMARRALRLAKEYELHWHEAKVLALKKDITLADRDLPFNSEKVQQLNAEIRTALESIMTNFEIRRIYDTIFTYVRKRMRPAPDTRSHLETQADKLRNLEEVALRGFHAKRHFLTAWALYYQLQGDYENAFEYFHKCVELWEDHRHQIKDNVQSYFKALSNYGNLCGRMNDFATVREVVLTLRGWETGERVSRDDKAEAFQNIIHLLILYLLNVRDQKKIDSLLSELQQTGNQTSETPETPVLQQADLTRLVKNGLMEHEQRLNVAREMTICANTALYLIRQSNYPEAIEWLNRITNNGRSNSREDIQFTARLLLPLVHLEAGHYDFVEDHQLAASRRFFARATADKPEPDLEELVNMVLQFVAQQLRCTGGKRERTERYYRLYEQLHELRKRRKSVVEKTSYQFILNWLTVKCPEPEPGA